MEIEVKVGKDKQSKAQKYWQKVCKEQDVLFILGRTSRGVVFTLDKLMRKNQKLFRSVPI